MEGQLPQALDFEAAVIGALLLEKDAIDKVENILSPESFYSESNAKIYECILSLQKEGKPTDILTVSDKLRKDGVIESIGGYSYISKLTTRIASTSNIVYHAQIVEQKHIQRKLIQIGDELQKRGFDDAEDILDTINYAEGCLDSINATKSDEISHISEIVRECISDAETREKNAKNGVLNGIPSGFQDLDKLTAGFQKSDLIILAARPSVGKSACALHMAKSAAKLGINTCIFSLEMSGTSLVDRLILSEGEIRSGAYRSGFISEQEWNQIELSSTILSKLPIYIYDKPSSMSRIKSMAKKLNKSGKCDFVIIDYLQLADMEGGRTRENEVSESCRVAKSIAKTLNIPVLLLAQLNRSIEARKDRKPMLSDLRESGSIEQDADLVIFIDRPSIYGIDVDEDGNNWTNAGRLIIEKQRKGPTGEAKFRHDESMTKFFDYSDSLPINYYEKDPF